jgi:dephospho-CoA kinase
MLKVGLTGGLACGKSFVGDELARLGCHLVRADELGHEVLEPGGEAFWPVVREFGKDILDEHDRIDRRRLAAAVFNNPERLEKLNALVHPPVVRREEELVSAFAASDPGGISVVEAAILIETGSYRRFHRIVLVRCAEEQQVARAVKRGATLEEAMARIRRQMPLEEKQKFAHYVIDTSGAKEDTLRRTREVYEQLRSIKI